MPLVQLDFPNPLNVSVQLGDIAYFSNPIPVGIVGNPLSGEQWTSTTTPHLTNEQQHIIKIGEIVTIIPWDGTVSSIICDMPQDLFNQYFAQITASECEDPDLICPPGSFIMFSKDNKANMASILGYYASVEFRNSSQVKSEIFNVGTDFFESSK